MSMKSRPCWAPGTNVSEFACTLPTPQPEAVAALAGVHTIAVVGLSPKPERPSHRVARYLQTRGYTIIPIRPGVQEILGEKAFPSLAEYGRPVDLVDVFRRPEAVPEIVEQALRLGCKVIWMQEGVSHEVAAERARAAGMKVVQNLCLERALRTLRA